MTQPGLRRESHPFLLPPSTISLSDKELIMYWRLAVAYPEYLLHLSALLLDPIYHGKQVPRGNNQPVLLIPGFMAGDWTLWTMAGWLNRLGYRAYFSGIDWNVDCPNQTGQLLQWRLEMIIQETGQPVFVVGH